MSNTECCGTCWGVIQRIDDLERELAREKARAKELEEAGDLLFKYCPANGPESVMVKEEWTKAKGTK